jgi:hypothetical protein
LGFLGRTLHQRLACDGFLRGHAAQDKERLTAAPSGVQRAVDPVLAQFLPNNPTCAGRLPRGQLKKLYNRDVWQIDLPEGYRLRYIVDKSDRAVYIVYFGPHPGRAVCGRERGIRAKVQSQHAGSRQAR